MRRPEESTVELAQRIADDMIGPMWRDMQQQFGPAACAAAARITTDVYAYFGIATDALPVTVTIINSDLATLMATSDWRTSVAEHMRTVSKDSTGGPWMIAINDEDDPAPGAGHVVVYVPPLNGFLDVSISQAERSHKNITGLRQQITGNPLTDVVTYHTDEGVTVQYTGGPDGHRNSPNWRGTSASGSAPFTRITGVAIRRLKRSH